MHGSKPFITKHGKLFYEQRLGKELLSVGPQGVSAKAVPLRPESTFPLPFSIRITFTAPFNNMRTLKVKAQPTSVFRYRQSIARRFLPAFECFRARGDQIVLHSSDNEHGSAVVISWEDPPNTWLMAAKNAFVGWAFNFRIRVLLKSAVKGCKKIGVWKNI